jgi:putative GTP pyrophosphokinase
MTLYADKLADEFRSKRRDYQAFTADLHDLLEKLISQNGLSVVNIEKRAKDIDSFKEKVDRPEKFQKYKSCDDLTDLSATRIIMYLQDEQDRVCEIIKNNFQIDWENSGNKEELLKPDQFGYRSMHYVVSYPENRLQLAEFKRFAGKKAEIQVRTILQHAWAQIDWKLRYKTDVGVPDDIRRRLYRISALLEVAEDDVSRVSTLVEELRKNYEAQIESGNLEIAVNQESLDLFINRSEVVKELEKIAKENGYVIGPPHPRSRNPWLNLTETLNIAGVTRIDDLESRLQRVQPHAARFLSSVHRAWKDLSKGNKLVIDRGSLIRLFAIETSDQKVAKQILEKNPFGPQLSLAVQKSVLEQPQ